MFLKNDQTNLLKVPSNRASFILPYGKSSQCNTSENLKPSLEAPCARWRLRLSGQLFPTRLARSHVHRFLSAFLREFQLGCYYGRLASLVIR